MVVASRLTCVGEQRGTIGPPIITMLRGKQGAVDIYRLDLAAG